MRSHVPPVCRAIYRLVSRCGLVLVATEAVASANEGAAVSTAVANKCDGAAQFIATLAWPLVVLVALVLLRFWPGIDKLLGLVPRSIKSIDGPFGVKIEVDAAAAKEVRLAFDRSFDELREKADEEFRHIVEYARIRWKVGNAAAAALSDVLTDSDLPNVDFDKVRVTVHIQDTVFSQYLYQLVEYYPDTRGGGKAGRRFSQRFGIIGRAWRLQESIGKGNAIPNAGSPALAKRSLITDWGMYDEEAIPGSHGRPAYLCVLLKCEDEICGILFIDSDIKDFFGSDTAQLGKKTADDVAKSMEVHPKCLQLAKTIAEAIAPMRAAGTFLRVDR